MWVAKKNDSTVMRALEAQNNGQHQRAANLFREAGNQYRNPDEKKQLWDAAKRAERTHYSD